MRLKILGVEAALPTSAGTATTVGAASEVRLVHTGGGSTSHIVTITDGEASPTTVASFSLPPSESLVIRKLPAQKIYSADASIKATAVSYQA